MDACIAEGVFGSDDASVAKESIAGFLVMMISLDVDDI